MRIADYLVDYLIKKGTTDAFGLPGAVILEMIYAMNRRKGEFCPHLSYHEQAAGFAAVGYAQVSGKLGVAYTTRGPGFTNLITAIADAYSDSIPVLFLTSHAVTPQHKGMRIEANQEIDTCEMVRNITKYCKRIETIEEFVPSLNAAYSSAMSGRKGPVFLDINTRLWEKEITSDDIIEKKSGIETISHFELEEIARLINEATRPVILIGDGINQTHTALYFVKFSERTKVPVLSSRYAHDVIGSSPLYYGYIGSFGLRYSNFILAKADLIVSVGNRLNFPLNSESYKNIPFQARIVRIEVDNEEFSRDIPNAINFHYDLEDMMPVLASYDGEYGNHRDWIEVCNKIKKRLWENDVNDVIQAVDTILNNAVDKFSTIINDVGDHEFWISRACAHSRSEIKSLYSKNFASLGCALPKSIGAYYSMKSPVICFTGDQGLQMNIQDLQAIAQNNLPILIVIMNNYSSGMIRDKEKKRYGEYLHSTLDSGYGMPDISIIAEAYGLAYYDTAPINTNDIAQIVSNISSPTILNLRIDPQLGLYPFLPIGRPTQDMEPRLEESLYKYLNNL